MGGRGINTSVERKRKMSSFSSNFNPQPHTEKEHLDASALLHWQKSQ
jgi:hypothetical protein